MVASTRRECDLVMEGGITSGVVYPAAICELHRTYDFRCIGGASAGAIAAAATAAAQYHSNSGAADANSAFDRLKQLSDELCKPGFLINLFPSGTKTRPLLDVFLAGLGAAHGDQGQNTGGKAFKLRRSFAVLLAVARTLVRRMPGAAMLGGMAGLGLTLLGIWLVAGKLTAAALAIAALALMNGALIASVVGLGFVVFRELPKDNFGVAIGHSEDAANPALTDWLSDELDGLGGLQPGEDPPLTFGALRDRGITLEMISTNLSQMRPYVLPFEDHRWLFEEAEMRRYFPKRIVDHLVKMAHRSDRVTPPTGFHFLPDGGDLPIVFGARLSLSFPILVCALPLYHLDTSKIGHQDDAVHQPSATDLVRCLFSDGGICSNFPIHFFDRWFPSRPTFGISLVNTDQTIEVPQDAITLPSANRPEQPRSTPIPDLTSFLARIVFTAKDYRDTLQRQLPSYRERVVQIGLRAEEGGLNLDMPTSRIRLLVERGMAAGQKLEKDFVFEQHLWVRLRVLLPRLCEEIEALAPKLTDGSLDIPKLAHLLFPNGRGIYARDKEWCDAAQAFLQGLASARGTLAVTTASQGEPKPTLTLRATSRV